MCVKVTPVDPAGVLTQIYAGNAPVACCLVARVHKPVQDLAGWSTLGCWCPAVEHSLEEEVVEKSSASTPEAPNIHEFRLKTCREETSNALPKLQNAFFRGTLK